MLPKSPQELVTVITFDGFKKGLDDLLQQNKINANVHNSIELFFVC